jgi:hypothetical protein
MGFEINKNKMEYSLIKIENEGAPKPSYNWIYSTISFKDIEELSVCLNNYVLKEKQRIADDLSNKNKCIIYGCCNEKHQGEFIGDICKPCYEIITTGKAEHNSTNFIHNLYDEYKSLRDNAWKKEQK